MTAPKHHPSARTDREKRPPRRIYVAGFLDAIGLGMYLSFSAIYLNQSVGLSNYRVAVVLGTAGVASVLGAIPIARFADRFGLRRALAALFAARALSYAGLGAATNLWTALVAAAFGGVLNRGIGPLVQTALIAGRDQAAAVGPLARLRALRNAGMAVGALPTGAAVAIGEQWAFRSVMVAAAVIFLSCAAVALSLPEDADAVASRRAGRPRLVDNAAFLKVTVLYGALTLSAVLLGVGMALWITQQTDLPPWIVSANYVINTVLVVALQTRLARGSESPLRARRMMIGGGVLAATGSAVAPLSAWGSGYAPIVVAVLVVVLMTGAEIYVVAGGTSLALVHTPQDHRSTYLATFNLAFGVATVIGPTLISVSLGLGSVGWLAWAVFFAIASVAARTVALTPGRNEPSPPETDRHSAGAETARREPEGESA
ncbi:MFS transporter [Streptomyces sp. NRRL S-31]|uniref:MFS transporter n=1 Tax=Streptomyces sp. NRRL S-31 TaxID=1463898 RepID=UPI0004C5C963|nr:MFS transporter [Streptomyces sp. NRRL S-31]